MLPSSHISPIISPKPEAAILSQLASEQDGVPTSTTALALAEAFADFVSTSSRLENSYRELQNEVAALHQELGQRNEDLKLSLVENQRVRFALQQVVDSMPCGVLVVDAEGAISTINPEVSRVLGLDNTVQIASLSALKSLSGLDLRSAVAGGADDEREFRLGAPSAERWLQVRERSLDSAQTIFILSDITAHKRAERDREAARNATVLAEITTMLAHEIRNPLASLELFAELIEQDDEQRAEWISNLRAGIRSLSGTVNNVLSMHDNGSLRLAPLSLNETVTNAIRFVQPVAKQSSISLLWTANEIDTVVLGNDSALQQVLLNLIRNAIRHTPENGTVTLNVLAGDSSIEVSCTDSGCGIREDQLRRLFEAGFSGSGDTPGLGLAVCTRIMAKHNGTISAANAEGAGARFVLSFPTFQEEFQAA